MNRGFIVCLLGAMACSGPEEPPKDTAPPVQTGPQVDCEGVTADGDMTFYWATDSDSGFEYCPVVTAQTCKGGMTLACGSSAVMTVDLANLPGNTGPAAVNQVELKANQVSYLWFDIGEATATGTFELTGGFPKPPEAQGTFAIEWSGTEPAAVCGVFDVALTEC